MSLEKEINSNNLNDNQQYTFETDDLKSVTVDSRIKNFSKLFNHIIQDYEINSSKSKLKGVNSDDIQEIINFCKAIDFNHDIKIFSKPLKLNYKDDLNYLFDSYPNLNSFYTNLNSNNIFKLAKIADFFDVHLLEDLLYLKLHEIFSTKENIENFFKEECEENNTDIKNYTVLNKEREKYLRDKYMIYIDKYISQLSDEEVDIFLQKELENKTIN